MSTEMNYQRIPVLGEVAQPASALVGPVLIGLLIAGVGLAIALPNKRYALNRKKRA